jgi:branched-subunit amino acid ABC-type transport system permease component
MDFLNAIILLLNYIFIPALTYGSQLALGAIFVTLIYGILRFANFATGDMMSFGTMVTILFSINWNFTWSIANSFNSYSFCNFIYDYLHAIY